MLVKFYSGTLLRTIAQETASQTALRNCSKEVSEEPAYIYNFAGEKKMSNIKRLLLITKNGHLKLKILVLFCVWEDARIWGH